MSKKVSEFNKEELIAHMKSSGEIRRPDKESKAWARAFKLFQQEQGVSVDLDCGKCWDKVKNWIGRP